MAPCAAGRSTHEEPVTAILDSTRRRDDPPAVSVTPVPLVSFSTAFTTAGASDANAAHGAGFLSWWHGHGKQVAEVVGCALDGAAIGRMLALGMIAGGGAWAAAGLAAAAIACLA